MPIYKYQCNKCDFSDEYIESFSTTKDNWHPNVCPSCKKGKLKRISDWINSHGGFDIVGSCYTNDYGRKAWKRNMSQADQAKVLSGEKDPY
jgi:putative FmdB family regulatory protein